MFQSSYTARQQYLAAQEEARVAQLRAEAAKAEYLAQEALLQEEAALKARLYEIEQRKRYASTNPYALTADWHFAQPYAASYPSFSPPGLPLPTRQTIPPANFFELERQRHLEIQTLERLHKEAEQERRRKEYEAKLVVKAELERKKRIEAIKAAKAFAQSQYCTHAPSVSPVAHREGTKVFFSAPTLKSNTAPAPKVVPQPPALPRQPCPFADLDGKFMLASLFGLPTTSIAKHQVAAKAPPQSKANLVPTPTQKAHSSSESFVEKLKASSMADNDKEADHPFLEILNALNASPASAQQVPKDVLKKSAVETSLVEQLQARSKSEHDQELRDTIQATLNSLLPDLKPSASPTPSAFHPRGNSKTRPEPQTPTVESRFEEIQRIEEEFRKFESAFNFPSQLDFVSTPNAATTALAHLAYTTRNHPVRFYEQALGSLLTELDSIESHGDAALRSKRKETVNLVERALEALEEQIMGSWNASKAKEEAPVESPVSFSVPISDARAPEEEKISMYSAEPTPAPVPEDAPVESSGTQASALEEPQQANAAISLHSAELTVEASDDSTSQAQPQPEADSLPEITLEELEQLEASEDASPSESQLTIKPQDGTFPSIEEGKAVKLVELTDPEETDSNDGFLVTQPDSEDDRPKRNSSKSRIEDISSDWSDLEA